MDKYDILKLDNQFCFSLYALSKEVTRMYKPFLDNIGITYTQYITLLVLWEKDAISINEIGERICLDSGTLTPLLKKLEHNGFVIRTRAKEDERTVIISLTEKGNFLKEEALKIPMEVAKKTNLSFDTIKSVRDTLKEIYKNVEK